MTASRIALGLLLAFAILVAACSSGGLDLEGPDAGLGRALVADLQARNLEALEARLDPAVRNAASRATLKEMAEALPSTPPTSVRVAWMNVTQVWKSAGGATRHVFLSLQYQFDDKWVLIHARWRNDDGAPAVVEGLHLQPIPASLETLNRFTLEGKGVLHWTVLALAVALPVFSVAVLVLCLVSPMPWPRKTLWALGILVGLGTLQLNWTTGSVMVQPLSFRLLSAGFLRVGQLGPWTLAISVPVFAILFLVKRRSAVRAATAPAAP